jgi:hypothetical protein
VLGWSSVGLVFAVLGLAAAGIGWMARVR